jgi:hypothetical protein
MADKPLERHTDHRPIRPDGGHVGERGLILAPLGRR